MGTAVRSLRGASPLAMGLLALACSSGKGTQAGPDGGGSSGDASRDARPGKDVESADHRTGSDSSSSGGVDSASDGPPASDAGLPAGWLFTKGGGIYVSKGGSASAPWMGRGVNVDDIFLCGYNYTLWMTSPDATLTTLITNLITGWKPNFLRVSLGMNTYPTVVSFLGTDAQYKTPMINVISAIGKNPGVYVLVTLRSDVSMIGQDTGSGDPEATGLPSDGTTTPDATKYPTGTDAVYTAIVDAFAHDSFVLFGLSNEPGGNTLSNDTIAAAMNHAVGVIRAEEDHLGVPHHIVSVQGNGWTSDISFYAASPPPITYDNVVYEVHGYPPATSSYTYPGIPVILGEYGSLTDSTSFYADVESKQISNLAWDFEPYSDCSPDLLTVNQSSTSLVPTAWGMTVQSYLLAH